MHHRTAARSIRCLSRSTIRPTNAIQHTRACIQYRALSTSQHQLASSPLGSVGGGAKDAAISTPATLLAPDHLNPEEQKIWKKLNDALSPTKLEVQDISGGCGSMYGIEILSDKFKNLNMLKQQRLVNEVLKDDVKGWHGVQMKTGVPKD